MLMILTALLVFPFYATQGLAHGEEIPGPHGGYVQMPANFHTEVVPDTSGALGVY